MAAPARTRRRTRARRPAALETPVRQPQDLALVFATLELELSGLAQEALSSGQVDTVRGRRNYQRYAQSLIAHVRSDARVRVQEVIEAAYGDGARLAGARAPGAIQRATIDQIAQAAIVSLDGSLDTVGRQFDDVFRRVGLGQASRQLERELPRPAAVDLMRQELQRKGMTGFVDRAGRNWRLSTYSSMALRTTTAEASNRGVAEAMSATGRDLIRISLPEGHPGCRHHPDDPTNPCRAYEGQTLSLFGKTKGFLVLPSLPPWHPQCEHHIAPAPESA